MRLLLCISGDLERLGLRLGERLDRRERGGGELSRLLLRVSRRSSRLLSLRAMSGLRVGAGDRDRERDRDTEEELRRRRRGDLGAGDLLTVRDLDLLRLRGGERERDASDGVYDRRLALRSGLLSLLEPLSRPLYRRRAGDGDRAFDRLELGVREREAERLRRNGDRERELAFVTAKGGDGVLRLTGEGDLRRGGGELRRPPLLGA